MSVKHLCVTLFLFVIILALPRKTAGLKWASSEQPPNRGIAEMNMQGTVDSALRNVVEHFIEAADRGDVATVAAIYAPDFMCVRVADEGGFVQLTREQMLAFWKNAASKSTGSGSGAQSIPTQKTTIHHAEVLGDTGYVLLTRIKNIGNGWEPMFYNLVWKKQGSDWRLLREFVHQKSIPKQNLK